MKEQKLVVNNKTLDPIVKQVADMSIASGEDMASATALLSQLNKYNDQVIEYKESKTKPLNQALKIIRAETKPLEELLENSIATLKKMMGGYQQNLVAIQAAEEAKISARVGEGKGKLKMETAIKKLDALDTVENKVKTDEGQVSFRTVRKMEVVDISLIPMEYHLANEVALRKAMLAGIEVAGVRYFDEQQITNRR